MSKTFQFTNRHGREVQVDQEQAKFIYGKMQFDGEMIPTTKKVPAQNEDGSYKTKYVENKDGSYKKDSKGNYKTDYVYEEVKSFELDPESIPGSDTSDYKNTGQRIELKSGMTKGGSESPASKHFKNKKSVQ